LHVKKSQTIALIGPTGVGKSTLVSLLLGFYKPSCGRILIDGQDIRKISLQCLRRQISVVSQEPFLFSGTVRENILYGRLNASDDEMLMASQAANCHDFAAAMPDGYDTIVGEHGARLSSGEKQRISIARAILKNAPILILDEATASIDTSTEHLVQKALSLLCAQRTTIIIAHRLSTIRHVDQIAVLHDGEIVEYGDHGALMKQNGKYATIYFEQTTST
jgi:ATP-binding cassette subfamily B protein